MEKQKVSFELSSDKRLTCESTMSNKVSRFLQTTYNIGNIIKFSHDKYSEYFIIDDMFSKNVRLDYKLDEILDDDIELVNKLIQLDPMDENDFDDSDEDIEDIDDIEQRNQEDPIDIKLLPIFVIGKFLKLSSNNIYIPVDEVSILYLNVPFEFLHNTLIYDISSINVIDKIKADENGIIYDLSYINKLYQYKINKIKLELEDRYYKQLSQLRKLERKYKGNKYNPLMNHRTLKNQRFLIHQKLEKLNTTRKHLQQYSKENYPEYRLHESLYPTKKTKKYFKKFW